MSLLEDLSAKGAPSRLLYDDEFEGPEAQHTDPSSAAAFAHIDPTTRFPWTAASDTTVTPAITTLVIAVDALSATWLRAFLDVGHTGQPQTHNLGDLRVTYPQPYAANRSSEHISLSLPVLLAAPYGIACVSLDTLTTFPAELHTALITSLLNSVQPKRILALTSGSLTTLPRTVRADMDDDRPRVLALRNNLGASKGVALAMPAPMTLADVSAAALVQSTLASLPASIVAVYLPHVRGAPEVSLAAMIEWSRAIHAELGPDGGKWDVEAVAKRADKLSAEQAAKFHPMYL